MATERELVRCGCGLVRNDDDRPFPMLAIAFHENRWTRADIAADVGWEAPRSCRGCGCVYQLPKPTEPR
jgi:hypothetical protein